jgi:phosphopantothenoylcysteine decarboxylase/phosphopantothenate--cysteine ligase
MLALKGKKILVGVCGSIAAYKSALIVRLLKKAGAEVRIVMSTSASAFITPLTLSTLSQNPVISSFEKAGGTGEWNNHVEAGLWADLMLIAPASAHIIAKMANGLSDNVLTAIYLSARCPVWVAPAMDLDMFVHPSTTLNLERLRTYGNTIIEPGTGELASGLYGKGRMAEPEEIVAQLELFFLLERYTLSPGVLQGCKVLLTAGPTIEAIDPVRFISNHSSGKMGYAIAQAAAAAGADVHLVSGPVQLSMAHPRVLVEHVQSARQMFLAVKEKLATADVIIHAAAVADYTPTFPESEKIKKKDADFQIQLKKTEDIAAYCGNRLEAHQVHIGFALETEHETENALKKLSGKNFDMIVLNSLRHEGAGFGHDTNRVQLLFKNGETIALPLQSKQEVAMQIIAQLRPLWEAGQKNKAL